MRTGKKKTFLFLLWLIACSLLFKSYTISQVPSLSPQLIGTTGGYSTINSGFISFSVGEPIVSTLASGSVILTQGFQQPESKFACPTSIGNLIVTPNNNSICTGTSITIAPSTILPSSGHYIYSWQPGGETTSVISITPTTTTSYSFSLVGCRMMQTDTITVNPIPLPVISTNTSTDVCLGQAIILSVTSSISPCSYSWSTGDTLQKITITPSNIGVNTYSLIAKHGGCTNGTSINISVNPLPIIKASSSTALVCAGNADTLTASSTNVTSYLWNPGSLNGSSIIVMPTVSTTYSITVRDKNNCINTVTVPISVSKVAVDAGGNISVCPGHSAPLNAITNSSTNTLNYLWSPGIYLNDSLIQDPSASPDSTTTFVVRATNPYGCYNNDTVTVSVVYDGTCDFHIYNGITPNGDGNNDVWQIDGIRYFPHNNVSIYNRWGTLVWSASKYDNKNVVWKGQNLKGTLLPSGTYYYIINIKLKNGSTQTFTKWIELTR